MTDRAEWLAERRKGIGSSDVAGLVRGSDGRPLSPWASPWSIYEDKRLGTAPELTGPHLEWGQRIEPAIIDWCADRRGYTAEHNRTCFVHPAHDHHRATPDALVGDDGMIEAKAPRLGEGWGDPCEIREWFDGAEEIVPAHYYVQVMWQLHVTGRDWCDLACATWPELRVYRIWRHEPTISALAAVVNDYWDRYIVGDDRPDVEDSDAYRRGMSVLYPGDPAKIDIQADAQSEEALERWIQATADRKDAEQRRKLADADLRAAIQDAYRLTGAAGAVLLTRATESERVAGLSRIREERPDLAAELEAAGLITKSTTARSLRAAKRPK